MSSRVYFICNKTTLPLALLVILAPKKFLVELSSSGQQALRTKISHSNNNGQHPLELISPDVKLPILIIWQTTALKSIKSLAPLLDRILVQRVKAEAKTASGIFLPESAVKELNEAKVLAVGPGNIDKEGKRIPMSVTAGDKVLIPQV